MTFPVKPEVVSLLPTEYVSPLPPDKPTLRGLTSHRSAISSHSSLLNLRCNSAFTESSILARTRAFRPLVPSDHHCLHVGYPPFPTSG
ncbi:hypothetical protein D3C72_1806030 [compost metagenome]